jgi:hypothetical protein
MEANGVAEHGSDIGPGRCESRGKDTGDVRCRQGCAAGPAVDLAPARALVGRHPA